MIEVLLRRFRRSCCNRELAEELLVELLVVLA
jgi:hypothetical protein